MLPWVGGQSPWDIRALRDKRTCTVATLLRLDEWQLTLGGTGKRGRAVATGAACRVSPDVHSRRRLWGDSGGYCGNPACRAYLFPDDLDVDFGELAHVIPASLEGPRGVPFQELGAVERAHHSNLILLCANCHTTIDKAPASYPTEELHAWKARRIDEIRASVATPTFTTRVDARAHISAELVANRTIHTRYGPTGDPYRDGNPVLWLRFTRSTIVPNNRKILQTLRVNRHLLASEERETLALFQLHVQQFEDRHILGDFTTGTERFPVAMESILLDEGGEAHEGR